MLALFRAQSQSFQGFLFGLLTFLCWSLADTSVKFAGQSDLPFVQIIFLISLISFSFLSVPQFVRKRATVLRPHRKVAMVSYGVLISVTSLANVWAFTNLPLVTVYIAYFCSPLIISLIGWLFLKEPFGGQRAAYLIISFMGAVYALNPFAAEAVHLSVWEWCMFLFLPLSFSAQSVLTRVLRTTEAPEALASFPQFVRVVLFLIPAIWMWQPMSANQILSVGLVGLFLAGGNLCHANALRKAPTTVVAPLHYTQLIYGAVLGYVFWQDVPTQTMIIGSLVVVIAGVAAARLAGRDEG